MCELTYKAYKSAPHELVLASGSAKPIEAVQDMAGWLRAVKKEEKIMGGNWIVNGGQRDGEVTELGMSGPEPPRGFKQLRGRRALGRLGLG